MKISMWRSDFPESTNPLKFFAYASRPHWKPAAFATAAVVIAATLLTLVSYVFKAITNAVAALPQTHSFTPLLVACAYYIGISFLGQVAFRLSGFAGARWATGSRATARYALSAYVTLHSRGYFSDRFAGSISNKISHASNGMRQMTEQFLWQFLELIVSVVASFLIAFFESPLLGWIFLLWVTVAFSFNVFFSARRIPLSFRAQELETRLNGATVDLLGNITTMQEYARRLFEIERIKSLTDNRRIAGLRNWYYGDSVLLFNGLLQALFAGGMIFEAVHLASGGIIVPADIVLVLSIIFRIEGLLLSLGQHLNGFGETWGEVKESLEEILTPHEIPDAPTAEKLSVLSGAIDISHLDFHYGTHEVFSDFTLHIPARQRVGLVGRSGAGKSTLLRLLLHHHDLNAGTITIDGVDISAVTQESLREGIAVVPQEPLLFHRTIAENIAYGNPRATPEEVERAARLAQAHEFIVRTPSGYQSMVGERGVKLSGGERQRIAIARAILKNAPILLMDEATSALDSESEVSIQRALAELMKGKTVIAIAHRLSTLRGMDRLIVLDKGSVAEEGSHEELVAKGGTYAELWKHQAGGFLQD